MSSKDELIPESQMFAPDKSNTTSYIPNNTHNLNNDEIRKLTIEV